MGLATFPDAGVNLLDKFLLGKVLTLGYEVRLYTNIVSIGPATLTADFDECLLSGYAMQLLVASSWTGGVAGEVATYVYPTLTYSFAAYAGPTVTIYGYYVTDPATGITLACEPFAPAYPVPLTGGAITLDLTEILAAA